MSPALSSLGSEMMYGVESVTYEATRNSMQLSCGNCFAEYKIVILIMPPNFIYLLSDEHN
jgi:hypothetical protein